MKQVKKVLCIKILFVLFLSFSLIGIKSFSVNVSANSTIKLNKTKMTLIVGERSKLKVKNTTKNVVWSSSNKKIVKVSKKGTIRGIKQGTATITAKVGNKKLTCKVKVKSAIGKISTGLSIENVGWKGIYYYADEVYCKSSNTDVATVAVIPYGYVENNYEKEADIVVFGHKTGTTNITITNSYNDEKVTFKVKVKKPKVSTDYQKLVDYILLNGEVEEGTGDKNVFKECKEKNAVATICYDTMEEHVEYRYVETNDLAKVEWLMMPTENETTEMYMVLWIYPVNSTEEYYVTTKIDTKIYNEEKIVFEEGWYRIPAKEEWQGIANEVSKNAINCIDEILKNEVGVSWREGNKVY